MKRKFISCFLSLVLIVSSSVYSFADDNDLDVSSVDARFAPGIFLAPEFLGVLATIAVASGVILNDNDDLYDLARTFYEKNKENWDNVNTLFKFGVTIGANKVVNVSKDFLSVCKSTFDSIYNHASILSNPDYATADTVLHITQNSSGTFNVPLSPDDGTRILYSLPYTVKYISNNTSIVPDYQPLIVGMRKTSPYNGPKGEYKMSWQQRYLEYPTPGLIKNWEASGTYNTPWENYVEVSFDRNYSNPTRLKFNDRYYTEMFTIVDNYILPQSLDYSWDNNISADLKTDDSLDLFVPGNAGSLVGGNFAPGDIVYNPSKNPVFNPPYELPNKGTVSVPKVDNPSIGLGDSVSIPTDGVIDSPGDIPSDVPVDIPLDWIINLVVPSDTYWVDKFNSIRDNISNKFPGVDSDVLKGLCVEGTPLKDHSIKIMNSNTSAVAMSGTTINRIADWVKPVIQGIVAIFLVLYNYNQVYYIIRGTKPFSTGKGD